MRAPGTHRTGAVAGRGVIEAGRGVIEAVVFDLSGVVCQMRHERRLAALAAHSDATAERIDAEIWQSGLDDAFDLGQYSREEIFGLFQTRFGFRGDYATFARAWVDGFAPDRDLLAVLDRLRPAATRAILSDNGPVLLAALPSLLPQVARRFPHVFFSCELGALKPTPHLYDLVAHRLGHPAARLLFFDDLASNVAAAREAGWQASRYTGAAAAEATLHRAGLLVGRRDGQ